MEIAWLEVRDFRSYRAVTFRPAAGINVLVGGNGTGKTSLLEAIGYLSALRSFRRAPDAALVRFGADAAVIRGEFRRRTSTIRVEVEIPREGRRRVLVNGKRAAGRGDVAAAVALVTFLPDDLDLVKRGPAYRREYLDDLAAQLWPPAGAAQLEYERVLRQRNALLRRDGSQADEVTLDVLDDRLAANGAAVVGHRLAVLAEIGDPLGRLYRSLGDGAESIGWEYIIGGVGKVDGGEDLVDELADAIAAARRVDGERRTTTVGPHRDEVGFFVGDRDLRTRASQGEQRSVALGLRVAAYQALVERRGAAPVLVLDDVFSELDSRRSRRLVELLPGGQVFVTSARREEVPLQGTTWAVADGAISEASA